MSLIRFDGHTFSDALDSTRLTKQYLQVFALMCDGQWRTLEDIATWVGASTQSVSARLRDMRKPRFGGHTVERERIEGGLYRYRLTENLFGGLK